MLQARLHKASTANPVPALPLLPPAQAWASLTSAVPASGPLWQEKLSVLQSAGGSSSSCALRVSSSRSSSSRARVSLRQAATSRSGTSHGSCHLLPSLQLLFASTVEELLKQGNSPSPGCTMKQSDAGSRYCILQASSTNQAGLYFSSGFR